MRLVLSNNKHVGTKIGWTHGTNSNQLYRPEASLTGGEAGHDVCLGLVLQQSSGGLQGAGIIAAALDRMQVVRSTPLPVEGQARPPRLGDEATLRCAVAHGNHPFNFMYIAPATRLSCSRKSIRCHVFFHASDSRFSFEFFKSLFFYGHRDCVTTSSARVPAARNPIAGDMVTCHRPR
jgi:hypothetical protein